jgi:hypothetical protein
MKIKNDSGVKVDNLSSAILIALQVAENVYKRLGVPHGVTITSGNEGYPGDGVHHEGSKHYPQNNKSGKGEAVDIRIWDVNQQDSARRIREALTEDYDVVEEGSHTHIEHDEP